VSGDLDVLARAHALFADPAHPAALPTFAGSGSPGRAAGIFAEAYRQTAAQWGAGIADAGGIDAEVLKILDDAGRDHDEGRRGTGAVLAAARMDTAPADNPIAARELLRRRVIRLRAQRRHLLTARRRARRRRAALLALRYRLLGHGRRRDARAGVAVRAAMSRLGCPYLWGAAGPGRFDCSGLVKWAYAQAGVPLPRTTYEQITAGVPVARSQVLPGDLVFPHSGHVQIAISRDLVVEAPYPGARVQISALGAAVAIRRPV